MTASMRPWTSRYSFVNRSNRIGNVRSAAHFFGWPHSHVLSRLACIAKSVTRLQAHFIAKSFDLWVVHVKGSRRQGVERARHLGPQPVAQHLLPAAQRGCKEDDGF